MNLMVNKKKIPTSNTVFNLQFAHYHPNKGPHAKPPALTQCYLFSKYHCKIERFPAIHFLL